VQWSALPGDRHASTQGVEFWRVRQALMNLDQSAKRGIGLYKCISAIVNGHPAGQTKPDLVGASKTPGPCVIIGRSVVHQQTHRSLANVPSFIKGGTISPEIPDVVPLKC
jgi:hypothetical protein